MLLPLSAIAQAPTFESLLKEYSLKEECTTINISNAMLKSMAVNIDAEYMQVIAVENKNLIETFRSQALEALSEFDVIMSVNSGGKSVQIYQFSDNKGSVVDIYMMSYSGDECVLMHITGKNLELNSISSIMDNM